MARRGAGEGLQLFEGWGGGGAWKALRPLIVLPQMKLLIRKQQPLPPGLAHPIRQKTGCQMPGCWPACPSYSWPWDRSWIMKPASLLLLLTQLTVTALCLLLAMAPHCPRPPSFPGSHQSPPHQLYIWLPKGLDTACKSQVLAPLPPTFGWVVPAA